MNSVWFEHALAETYQVTSKRRTKAKDAKVLRKVRSYMTEREPKYFQIIKQFEIHSNIDQNTYSNEYPNEESIIQKK